MNQKGFISSAFGIIITLVIAAGVGGYVYVQSQIPNDAETIPSSLPENKQPSSTTPPQEVACTQEAKQCPDGSYVGRTGPKCEFAACPGEKPVSQSAVPSDWKTYRNEQYGFEVKYPNDWQRDPGLQEPEISFSRSRLFGDVQETYAQVGLNAQTGGSDFITLWKTTLASEKSVTKEIAGVKAVVDIDTSNPNKEQKRYALLYGNTFYSISTSVLLTYTFKQPKDEITSDKDIIEQILSTFRFTK